MFRLSAVLVAVLLAACAARVRTTDPGLAVPWLQLPPAALPQPLALQQRLTFRHGERRDTVDALVESDADGTRVAIHAQWQVALRLDWDGATLRQQRAPWLPAALDGERVLADLQLVYWPAAAIRAALPQGWRLEESGGHRLLRKGDSVVATVDYPEPQRAHLEQRALDYTLDIASGEVVP